jgi:hypothetical protein
VTEEARRRALVILLRLGGCILVSAFGAIALPVEWMACTHEWLGLGEFPRAAIVDYLARSVSALYGFHGVLLLLIATDPVRYRAIVTYVAVMNVLLGAIMLGIDIHAGLPIAWTVLEGPPLMVLGAIIVVLNRPARV